MNLDLLNKMTTDGLKELRKAVDTVLASRLDTRLAPGRTGEFVTSDKVVHKVRIDKLNIKTVSVTEIEPKPGKKWKVSMSMLRVDPIERSKVAPVKLSRPAPHKPAAAVAGDHW